MRIEALGGRQVLQIGPSPPGVGASDTVIGTSWNNESGTSPPLWPSFMKSSPGLSTFAKMTASVAAGLNYTGNWGGIPDPGIRTGAQIVLTARDTGTTNTDARFGFAWLGPGPTIVFQVAWRNHLESNGAFVFRLGPSWQTFKYPVASSKLSAAIWGVPNPISITFSGLIVAGPGTIDVARFVVEIYK